MFTIHKQTHKPHCRGRIEERAKNDVKKLIQKQKQKRQERTNNSRRVSILKQTNNNNTRPSHQHYFHCVPVINDKVYEEKDRRVVVTYLPWNGFMLVGASIWHKSNSQLQPVPVNELRKSALLRLQKYPLIIPASSFADKKNTPFYDVIRKNIRTWGVEDRGFWMHRKDPKGIRNERCLNQIAQNFCTLVEP